MVAEASPAVDVDGAVREWARDFVDAIGRRAFFGAKNGATFPQIVVQRIGGTDDNCLVQFDVWGATQVEAQAARAQLVTAAEELAAYTHEGVRLIGARIDSSRWLPDPESDKPRYIVDVTFTATASE